MRISDWSSDVCSSDLAIDPARRRHGSECREQRERPFSRDPRGRAAKRRACGRPACHEGSEYPADRACPRSEEHTSELQSLMRISYAVFCLKKKIKSTIN